MPEGRQRRATLRRDHRTRGGGTTEPVPRAYHCQRLTFPAPEQRPHCQRRPSCRLPWTGLHRWTSPANSASCASRRLQHNRPSRQIGGSRRRQSQPRGSLVWTRLNRRTNPANSVSCARCSRRRQIDGSQGRSLHLKRRSPRTDLPCSRRHRQPKTGLIRSIAASGLCRGRGRGSEDGKVERATRLRARMRRQAAPLKKLRRRPMPPENRTKSERRALNTTVIETVGAAGKKA